MASSFGQQVRLLDRSQRQCHANLLLSIHADATALEDLHARWLSHVPVFANVRCGRWCASPFDSEAGTPPHVAGALPQPASGTSVSRMARATSSPTTATTRTGTFR
jgi:hypothetical protein